MDSIKLANFLYQRIRQTITYRTHVKAVEIGYEWNETYGNEYIRISYTLNVHDSFLDLSFNDQEFVFRGTPNYVYSLSTHATRFTHEIETKLLRIIEFKQIYESVTASAIMQLQDGLSANTTIKVKGIDFWPLTNYARKYLLDLSHNNNWRSRSSNFETEVGQWNKLHKLSKESKKIYVSERGRFSTSDLRIQGLFEIDSLEIRSILIDYNIPIQVKGIKIIEKVIIHTAKFVQALKEEIAADHSWKRHRYKTFRLLILYLYDHYLPNEKEQIVHYQQQEFLKVFPVQQGDILEIKDKRLVVVDAILIDKENTISCKYYILKNNLEQSERTGTVKLSEEQQVLKKIGFLQYLNDTPVKHLSLLQRWMAKKRSEQRCT